MIKVDYKKNKDFKPFLLILLKCCLGNKACRFRTWYHSPDSIPLSTLPETLEAFWYADSTIGV